MPEWWTISLSLDSKLFSAISVSKILHYVCFLLGYPINKKSSVLPKRVCSKCYDPVWARVHYRISPPRLLAECRNWRLKQGSFVLLYFVLFALLSCIQFVYIPVLFCLSSDWLRNPPPKYVWGGALNSAPVTPTPNSCGTACSHQE